VPQLTTLPLATISQYQIILLGAKFNKALVL
jgi:hypothetical protein